MMKQIVLATQNGHKVAEMRHLLKSLPWDICGAEGLESPEEDGKTFEANAQIKSTAAVRATGKWALADDSGLCVDALGGAPGVDTAYYGGWQKLLEALQGEAHREASFVCVLALTSPTGETHLFKGICPGSIAPEGRGAGTFAYDPVFIPQGDTRTFAEMTPDEKAQFSHRAAAVQSLLNWAATHVLS